MSKETVIKATNGTDVTITRDKQYGGFDAVAYTSDTLLKIVSEQSGWYRMMPVQKEGIRMTLHKIARIVCGDPNYEDSWVDAAGYLNITMKYMKKDNTK